MGEKLVDVKPPGGKNVLVVTELLQQSAYATCCPTLLYGGRGYKSCLPGLSITAT